MVKINRLITQTNRTIANTKKDWIVIHYVGAESTAYNNARYFEKEYRGASAHYFVDEYSIWQVVEDKDNAWHVGGAKVYYNEARNNNSIGIEMCCKKRDGKWYIEPLTIKNTIELTKMLCKKYGINPKTNVTTHYLTTHKICPEPFVRNPKLWEDFLKEVNMADIPELSMTEKYKKVKQVGNFDDGTIDYFTKYYWREPLSDKLYHMAVDAEKWRKNETKE